MNIRNDWHTISAEETAKQLNVNPYRGLSEKEVRKRRSEWGKNHIWYVRCMETGKAVLRAALDLSTVLLIITAVLALMFERRTEAVTLCVILVFGALLRIITYIRAKRILENNASESVPTAAVLRDGVIRLISSVDLVPGDIVLLHPGDTVPCDGRVISDHDSMVSESGITENKEPVHKYNTFIQSKPGSAAIPCESRPNTLYAGSTVLEGDPIMIASAVGEDTLISMKQGGIEIPSGDELPLIDRLNGRCRISELVMLAFVVIISAISLFTQNGLRLEQVFFAAVSTAAASMSEYLTTIGYIIVAIASRNAGGAGRNRGKNTRSGAVIKDCSKIEDIASADSIILGDISLLKSGKAALHSFFAKGKIHRKTEQELPESDGDALYEILALAAEAVAVGTENSSLSQSSTESAVREQDRLILQGLELFREETNRSIRPASHIIDHMNGDAAMASGIDVSILQPTDLKKGPYVAAASDVQRILRCCTTYRSPTGDLPLTNEIRKRIFTETARLEYIGAKVLAIAARPAPFITLTKLPTLLSDMCFVGFFSVAEMPADGVREAIRELKDAEARVILLSDNPEHDLYYGHDLGLFNKKTKIVPHTVSAEEIKDCGSLIITVPPYKHADTVSDLAASAARYRAIRSADGTNAAFFTKEPLDSRSLASVDCGIAISRSNRKAAAQALKNHAEIVVYPRAEEEHGGFAEGIAAMKEARRAIINTANASAYLTASQIARLFLLFVGVVFGLSMPNSAAILTSGLIFDFGAVLVMAFEKSPDRILSIPCTPLPDFLSQVKKTVLFGLSSALLSAVMPLLVNGAAPLLHVHPLKPKEEIALLTAALFLCQLSLAVQFMKRGRLLRRGVTFSSASVCCSAVILAASLLILFEKHVSSVFGGAPVPWYGAILAFLPCLILFFTAEIRKKLTRSGESKSA